MGVFTVRFDTDNAALVVINPLGAVVVVAADATRPRPSNRLARHAPMTPTAPTLMTPHTSCAAWRRFWQGRSWNFLILGLSFPLDHESPSLSGGEVASFRALTKLARLLVTRQTN